MSIESMKQALEDIAAYYPNSWAADRAKAAIQQAESEPCKSFTELRDRHREGVDAELAAMAAEAKTDVRCEGCGYMTHHREHMGCVRAAKQFTHPAPGVPDADFDLICNAIDKADTLTMEGDYMLDSDDCIAVVRVMQALLSVRAAMTAAQAQKGQP